MEGIMPNKVLAKHDQKLTDDMETWTIQRKSEYGSHSEHDSGSGGWAGRPVIEGFDDWTGLMTEKKKLNTEKMNININMVTGI